MASTRSKLLNFVQTYNRRFGKVKRMEFMPPPSSADMDAAFQVATKNSEIVAGAVLGLHGPPQEGLDAARKLMSQYVDWNEVRVSGVEAAAQVLGRDARAEERIALLQRFLEVYFLRQRNMNLDYLVALKPNDRKQFISNLEVFDREELPALLLTCFGHLAFPPSDMLHAVAMEHGLIRKKTTVLQMAREFQKGLDEETMLSLYSHLYALARSPEKPAKARKKARV
ncbi:MAG: hypothetical protein M5U26_21930 [Planctomycetota bacterium]|nr:hypothetical protein [Planctomycetota bacterium]